MQGIINVLGIGVVATPAVLLAVFGIAALCGVKLAERVIAQLTQLAVTVGLISSVAILVLMLMGNMRDVTVALHPLENWVHIEEEGFHFHLKFVFDRLSVPMVILSYTLCGVVGAFTSRYMHREAGFQRFFLFYAVFLLGMIASSTAGTIEMLFFAWELVGLSSALLVAYFHERTAPVRNGLRVWSFYRIADAAFLAAALLLHHVTGAGDFDVLMGTGPWPDSIASITAGQALSVGLLLLVAAAGKSALVPFSGWLPRAMEGPTPSTAVFYGALSVHLGAYLLLRVSPIVELSPLLSATVVLVGLVSAGYGALAARVQSDVKSALAFASLTQVGIIVAEIGLGFRYVPLIHIIGNACLRTLQLLRAPSLLHDYHKLENAIGSHLSHRPSIWAHMIPPGVRVWIYRFALERGYFDVALSDFVARPFLLIFRWCDAAERRWTDWLSSGRSRESDSLRPETDLLEEVL